MKKYSIGVALYDQTFVQSTVKFGQMIKDKGWKCLLPLKLPVLNYMLLFTENGWLDHEFRRSLVIVVAKIEGLWDAK